MGILSNTISICQFRVVGDRPGKDLYEWASDRLARNSFKSIDDSIDEVSSGWVHLDDFTENSFSYPGPFGGIIILDSPCAGTSAGFLRSSSECT
jgi:hypothetical protein